MKLKYFAYIILKTDYSKLNRYFNQLIEERKISKAFIVYDILKSLYKYNTSFLDYFYFRFFNENNDREFHTNIWDMYLFHKYYNKKNSVILRDKLLFRDRFKEYFNYPYFELKENVQFSILIEWIKEETKGDKNSYIVAKEP